MLGTDRIVHYKEIVFYWGCLLKEVDCSPVSVLARPLMPIRIQIYNGNYLDPDQD